MKYRSPSWVKGSNEFLGGMYGHIFVGLLFAKKGRDQGVLQNNTNHLVG